MALLSLIEASNWSLYSTSQNFIVVAFAFTALVLLRRLFFHPLSAFPGPKLAALTSWYEFYFDVIQGGRYMKKVIALHKQYNYDIIRISPNHLHINDPNLFQQIFGSNDHFLKAEWFYRSLGISGSLVSLTNPAEHRIRRQHLDQFFSGPSIDSKAGLVWDKAQEVADNVNEHCKEGKGIDIHYLFRQFAVDIIYQNVFGVTQYLESAEDRHLLLADMSFFLTHAWWIKHFPIPFKLVLSLPSKVSKHIMPGYVRFRNNCARWVYIATNRSKQLERDGNNLSNLTLFDILLQPDSEKNYMVPNEEALINEAFAILIAGSDSTAYSLSCAMYYLVTNRNAMLQLKEEVSPVLLQMKSKSDYKGIMGLPYLSAVIKESLRLSTPAPGMFPRIVPSTGIKIKDQFIPGGTSISISQRIIHDNESIFPQAHLFKPERWVEDKNKSLETWNVPFSKGPRRCLGLRLADLEMRICLAVLVSKFDFKLASTNQFFLEWVDYGIAMNTSRIILRAEPHQN